MILPRRSPRAALLLQAAVSGYLLYVGLSYSLDGRTTHELLLLSLALLTVSALALAAALREVRTHGISGVRAPFGPGHVPLGPGLVLLGAGGLLAVSRGWPLVNRVLTAAPPPGGGAGSWTQDYSTVPALALDLGVLAPAFLLAGVLVLRRRSPGLALAVPLLGMAAAMGPALASYALAYATGGPGGVAATFPRDVLLVLPGLLLLPAAAVWSLANVLRSPRD